MCNQCHDVCVRACVYLHIHITLCQCICKYMVTTGCNKVLAITLKSQKLFRFLSQFSSFFTTKPLFKCHFVGLTKAITPRICRLCVCVLINKPSFEHFVFRCCFRTLAVILASDLCCMS